MIKLAVLKNKVKENQRSKETSVVSLHESNPNVTIPKAILQKIFSSTERKTLLAVTLCKNPKTGVAPIEGIDARWRNSSNERSSNSKRRPTTQMQKTLKKLCDAGHLVPLFSDGQRRIKGYFFSDNSILSSGESLSLSFELCSTLNLTELVVYLFYALFPKKRYRLLVDISRQSGICSETLKKYVSRLLKFGLLSQNGLITRRIEGYPNPLKIPVFGLNLKKVHDFSRQDVFKKNHSNTASRPALSIQEISREESRIINEAKSKTNFNETAIRLAFWRLLAQRLEFSTIAAFEKYLWKSLPRLAANKNHVGLIFLNDLVSDAIFLAEVSEAKNILTPFSTNYIRNRLQKLGCFSKKGFETREDGIAWAKAIFKNDNRDPTLTWGEEFEESDQKNRENDLDGEESTDWENDVDLRKKVVLFLAKRDGSNVNSDGIIIEAKKIIEDCCRKIKNSNFLSQNSILHLIKSQNNQISIQTPKIHRLSPFVGNIGNLGFFKKIKQ